MDLGGEGYLDLLADFIFYVNSPLGCGAVVFVDALIDGSLQVDKFNVKWAKNAKNAKVKFAAKGQYLDNDAKVKDVRFQYRSGKMGLTGLI